MAPRELRLRCMPAMPSPWGQARQICSEAIDHARVPSLPLVVSWAFPHKRCWDLVETMNTSFR